MPLDLTQLLHLARGMPAYRRLVDELYRRRDGIRVVTLDAAKPYLIAALYRSLRRPVLVLTAQPKNGKKLQEQLATWCHSTPVRLFPEPDALPYERMVADVSTEMERVQVLSALAGMDRGHREPPAGPPLVVAAAPALMRKTTSYGDFRAAGHIIELGMSVDPFHLLAKWAAMGYRRESIVEVPGTMSHRGEYLGTD